MQVVMSTYRKAVVKHVHVSESGGKHAISLSTQVLVVNTKTPNDWTVI